MLAAVLDGEIALREDYPEPAPGEDEVLVGVRVAGICSTDLEILKGYMNFSGVIGHEFVGEAIAGPGEWAGKRVVAEINCPCGHCELCGRGMGNHCPNRTVIGIDGRDGAMAERIAVPAANLHEVPEAVSDDLAVFVEPLAAALRILEQVDVAGVSVLVLGDGRLGQLAARVLKARAGRLLLVGRHPGKLAAAENQGVATRLVDNFIPAADVDVAVDATGAADGFDLAMRAVRPRGTIVLKTTTAAESGMNLSPLVVNEITVVGSRCGPFDAAIEELAAGRVEVADLIGARFPLARCAEAFEAASAGENIKVLIDVQ